MSRTFIFLPSVPQHGPVRAPSCPPSFPLVHPRHGPDVRDARCLLTGHHLPLPSPAGPRPAGWSSVIIRHCLRRRLARMEHPCGM